MFPDANLIRAKKANKQSINNIFTRTTGSRIFTVQNSISTLKRLNLMKSSSDDNLGLLNKLANCLILANQIGSMKGFAQLWREFILELRFRYDSSILISGLSSNFDQSLETSQQTFQYPELGRCLLHQKIQMLNCCIQKRIERRAFEETNSFVKKNLEEESDDEFFDCEDSENSSNNLPDGRLKKFENLTLLNNSNSKIYIPITQVIFLAKIFQINNNKNKINSHIINLFF